MNLTPHFTLEELTRSTTAQRLGIANDLPPQLLGNIQAAADMLELIRTALGGVPIVVTSGYRSPSVNKAVGGVTSSDHTQGYAVDFVAPAYGTPHQIAKALSKQIDAVQCGQLILEGIKGKQWVHVSTHRPANPANRVITITDAGVELGIQELA